MTSLALLLSQCVILLNVRNKRATSFTCSEASLPLTMYRAQATKFLRASAARVPVSDQCIFKNSTFNFVQATRRAYAVYTAPPPHAPPPPPKKQSDNTLLYVAVGLAAAGGAYFYLSNPEDVQDMKDRARREATELKHKSKETADAAKSRAENVLNTGEGKFDQARVCIST